MGLGICRSSPAWKSDDHQFSPPYTGTTRELLTSSLPILFVFASTEVEGTHHEAVEWVTETSKDGQSARTETSERLRLLHIVLNAVEHRSTEQ